MPVFRPEDCFLSASELAQRIRSRQVSPVEVVDALAERIAKLNPELNAFITLDLENARLDAEEKWKMRQQHPDGDLGILHGVPVAIKDDIAVRGLRYTRGSRLCAEDVADYDDIVVARLKTAGAIILGKTHLPEFGHKGTTDNQLGPKGARVITATPWDRTRTAGGSSGGSAAAVAAGLAFLAVGTDIGGSIRIPASCCGIVGHKPSFGMIPRVPSGNAFSLWVAGPLARTVADAALAMRALSGPDERDRFSLPAVDPAVWDVARQLPHGLRLGWCPNPMSEPVDPVVAKTARQTLALLSEEGVQITDKQPLLPAKNAGDLLNRLLDLAGADLTDFSGIKDRVEFGRKADQLSPTFRQFAEPVWDLKLATYLEAQGAVTRFVEDVAAPYFADYDLLATPTLAVAPFDKHLDFGPDTVAGQPSAPHLGWCFTWPFNLTGHPAVSIPCGWTNDKLPLPIGLQLIGKRGQDGLVLRVAAAIEKLAPWASRRPRE